MLLVPKYVRDEARLSRTTLPYEYADLVVGHHSRVEFPQLNRHPETCGHISEHSAARPPLFSKQVSRMSAGEVQLAALGMQDAYLTGAPQVTYFRGVYRRHTPFSVQSFNIPFQSQTISWGSQGICRIPFKGDVIQSTTLAVTLPQLYPASTLYQWNRPVQTMNPQPYLFINGSSVKTTVTAGVQTYFIVPPPSPSWIGSALSPYVTYSSSLAQFEFTGVTSLAVYSADVQTIAVFWGLDPNGFSSKGTLNGLPATFWTFPGTTTPSNFGVALSGWKPYSASATLNAANSLLFVGPSISITSPAVAGGTPVILPGQGNQFLAPAYIQFQNFSNVIGVSSFISYTTKGGNLQFKYAGVYTITITATGLGAPTRIGVAHWPTDSRPITAYTYDFVYTYNVQFANENARAVLPIRVTDTSQYYFVEFEGATLGTIGADIEVIVEDINDFWNVGANAAIVDNTLPFSNLVQAGILQQITANTLSNTFAFGSSGLYNIYGTLSVNSANTISSVALIEQQLTGLNKFGQANVVSQWNSPQASSPSVNFALPVQVLNPTKNNYSIVVSTNDSAALGNAIALTSFGIEYFGTTTFPQVSQQNDFRQNGLLARANVANYTLSTSNINLYSISNIYGNSYHIAVTGGGNLNFSNVSQYRISAYIETSNAYLSNISVWSGASDAVLAASLIPGNETAASLVSSRSLPLGLQGGYSVDLIVPIYTADAAANNYQIRTGLTGTQTGQVYTNVTANTYFTFTGLTGSGETISYSYVDSVGTYLIQSAELRMGGQSIQTLTGEMIEIYNDLFVPQENQPGLTLLTGKQDASIVYNPRTYYINLPFFFYGSAELSLPICTLGLQDLEIWVTFNQYQNLLVNQNSQTTPFSVVPSMVVDYAYLSDPEVQWFQSHRQDYVFRQVQYDSFLLNAGLTFPINFLGPVRELYFVIQDASDGPYVYETDSSMGVSLTFNGEDYVDSSTMDYNFMRFIGPLEKYARPPTRVLHVIPLCKNPLNPRPTGSVNMSRIYQKNIQFNLPTLSSLATKTIRLLAVNYNILRVENGLAGIMYQ